MTKKELKDIILKTLEKEGGAAGIKALAKAAKTSKNKLKKDLDDMSGVKQHQDGDYISTPINEVETFTGSPEAAADFCQRCPTHMCSSVDYTPGGQVIAVCQELDPFDEFRASGAIGTGRIVGPRYRKPMSKKPMRLREVEDYVGGSMGAEDFCDNCPCGCSEVIQDYQPAGGGDATYAKCKEDCTGQDATSGAAKMVDPRYRKPMFKKPMRLREIKEIIKTMLDEKKKKKKDRCHRKADSVYGTKTSAYKSGAIVKCRKGMIWKVGSKKKK